MLEDLESWFPKIKKNGYIAGDDYYQKDKYSFTNDYGVVEAVNNFTKKYNLVEKLNIKGNQFLIKK